MTILSPNGNKTIYDSDTNNLTRIVGNEAKVINLDKLKELTIREVARMTNLDDEAFSLMAYIQKTAKERTCISEQ